MARKPAKKAIKKIADKVTPLATTEAAGKPINKALSRIRLIGTQITSVRTRSAPTNSVMLHRFLRTLDTGIVATCANINATGFASIEWQLVTKDRNGKIKVVTDNNNLFYRLLKDWNPQLNAFSAKQQICRDLDIYGNAFIAISQATDQDYPDELYVIPPYEMEVIPSTTAGQLIKAYRWNKSDGATVTEIVPENMIHIKRGDRRDDLYAKGCLESVWRYAELANMILEHSISTIENGGTPSAIISSKTAISEDDIDEATEMFNQRHNAEGAGRLFVLSGDWVYTPMTYGAKDASFVLAQNSAFDAVGSGFGVPADIIRMEPSVVDLGNGSAVQLAHLKGTVLPRVALAIEEINARLCPLFSELDGIEYLIVAIDPLQKAKSKDATQVLAAYTAGIIQENEARTELGFTPNAAGNRYVWETQSTVTPSQLPGLGMPRASLTAPDKSEGQEPPAETTKNLDAPMVDPALSLAAALSSLAAQVAEGKLTRESAMAIVRVSFRNIPMAELEEIFPATTVEVDQDGDTTTISVDEPPLDEPKSKPVIATWKDYLFYPGPLSEDICHCENKNKDYKKLRVSPEYIKAKDDESRLVVAMRNWVRKLVPDNVTESVNIDPTVAQDFFDKEVKPLLDAAYLNGINAEAAKVGLDPFSVLDDAANSILRDSQNLLIQSVSSTIKDRLSETLAAGNEAGETINQIRDRVEETVSGIETYAAERIARTELLNARESGRLDAWKRSDQVKKKEYLITSNAHPVCKDIRATRAIIGIDEIFWKVGESMGGRINNWKDIYAPPAHPNCESILGAVFEETEDSPDNGENDNA
jgi:HK97 family phage portal protein